jgi:hypothetical protein
MKWRSTTAVSAPGVPAETRLWQAVIVNTIQEWVWGPLRQKREAEEYLFGENSDFPAVCESAGMDVRRLRANLTRLRHQSPLLSQR